jgi:hypothetical protein
VSHVHTQELEQDILLQWTFIGTPNYPPQISNAWVITSWTFNKTYSDSEYDLLLIGIILKSEFIVCVMK